MPTDPILPRPYFDGKVTTIHAENQFVIPAPGRDHNKLMQVTLQKRDYNCRVQ